ncbi:MAG TPA: hypothetical protein VL095_17335 [Flavisolibacter sp.]|nr:hypothetical protein [Flavisolibacter sp.]
MKNIFIAAFFLLPFFAPAQDTCQLKTATDPFTHQTKISTGFIPFTANGVQLSISVDATPTEIDFFLWFTKDQKCFDEASTIQVNFEGDRYRLNLKNTGSMNCQGAFHFSFKNSANTPPQLQRLLDKRVSSFRITGPNKTITEVSLSEEQKAQLHRMAACVVRDSKTLLKK